MYYEQRKSSKNQKHTHAHFSIATENFLKMQKNKTVNYTTDSNTTQIMKARGESFSNVLIDTISNDVLMILSILSIVKFSVRIVIDEVTIRDELSAATPSTGAIKGRRPRLLMWCIIFRFNPLSPPLINCFVRSGISRLIKISHPKFVSMSINRTLDPLSRIIWLCACVKFLNTTLYNSFMSKIFIE